MNAGPRIRSMSLFALLVCGACDPSDTDPSFWDRQASPALSDAGDATGAPTSPGDAAASPTADAGPQPGNPGSAACAQVSFTTKSYRGEYAPENVGAVWITDASGQFVRTLEIWGNKRLQHAVGWRAASAGNTVDAISGATRPSHGLHAAGWDCKAADGSAVAPGSYTLHAEFTEENSSEGSPAGPRRSLSFDLTQADGASLPDDAAFGGLSVRVLP